MKELKCKECGQKFTSPSELQDHDERLHGGSKMAAFRWSAIRVRPRSATS